jgi:phosphoenolpyruvate synthase/pyruvate phosphate dikinase
VLAAINERLELAELPEGPEREITQRLAGLRGTHFAVRSSAVSEDSADRSFAGIFDSYLNVPAAQVGSGRGAGACCTGCRQV